MDTIAVMVYILKVIFLQVFCGPQDLQNLLVIKSPLSHHQVFPLYVPLFICNTLSTSCHYHYSEENKNSYYFLFNF